MLSFYTSAIGVDDIYSETVFLHTETDIGGDFADQDWDLSYDSDESSELSDIGNDSWFDCGLSL